MFVGPDAMESHRRAADAVDKEEIRSKMALGESGPVDAAFVEAVLSEAIRQFATGDHDIEDVLECFRVKVRVLARGSVVPLETRQDYQLSSQRMASRPL